MNVLLAVVLAIGLGLGVVFVAGFIQGGGLQTDRDVFAGTRRSIRLPPGWVVEPAHWRWQMYEMLPERVVVYGLEVLTIQLATKARRWRPVGEGVPAYVSSEHAPPDLPNTWEQETLRLPMDDAGAPIDLERRLKTCRRKAR